MVGWRISKRRYANPPASSPAESLMFRRHFLALLPAALYGDTEDGIVSLFDGRSLAGWTIRDGDTDSDAI
jgi:hypothetical protein